VLEDLHKLAPDDRLFAKDGPYQLQSHVMQKLSQISQIRPDQI